MLKQNLGGQTKSIMVFSKVAYVIRKIIHGCLEIWNISSRVQLDTSWARAWVRYRVEHLKKNSISPRANVAPKKKIQKLRRSQTSVVTIIKIILIIGLQEQTAMVGRN